MSTASKSLPSAYQLPIIVVMKIRFRIGAEQSNGQGSQERGKQSPRQQNWPVTPPSPWSLGSPVSSWTPPTENPADHSLRRGTARCARCNTADQGHPLASSRSIPGIAPCPDFNHSELANGPLLRQRKRSKTVQFHGISNRNWPTNRSYRKQMIKPCLTGTRIAHLEA